MKKTFRKFLLLNVLITLIIGVLGACIFLFLLPKLYHSLMPAILLFAVSVNLLNFRVIMGNQNTSVNIMNAITKSFAIKFFSYIGLIVVLILIEKLKDQRLLLVLFVFILYMIYTIMEVVAFIDYTSKKK